MFCIYNGEFLPNDKPVFTVKNRCFRYGDGLFESLRVINNKVCFISNHLERLKQDAAFFDLVLPSFFNEAFIEAQINLLLHKNGLSKDARIRISIFRKEGGYYTPFDNSAEYLIEAEAHAENGFNLNKNGLNIDIYDKVRKPQNKLSNIKSSNAIYAVMASIFKAQKALDDCLILNEAGNIAESTASNFFLVSADKLYTPALDQGCVAGTMRKTIIELAAANGKKVYECNILPDDLLAADELFLTNAITGIRWIGGFGKKRYFHPAASRFNELLRALIN